MVQVEITQVGRIRSATPATIHTVWLDAVDVGTASHEPDGWRALVMEVPFGPTCTKDVLKARIIAAVEASAST